MRGWKLAGIAMAAALLLGGCFNGTGSYPVGLKLQNGVVGQGLWHSSGGPDCSFSTTTFPLGGVVNPSVVEPARAGPRYVDFLAGDFRFDTAGCGPWVQAGGPLDALHPTNAYGVLEGDGDFRVGIEVPPGRYQATSPTTCSWQRVRDFGHRVPDPDPNGIFPSTIIASGTSDTVDIAPTDAGFTTSNCGAWRRIG